MKLNVKILRGISGTIGIILAVPFVSFVASILQTFRRKK